MFFSVTEVLSDTTHVAASLFFTKLCSIYLDIRKWQASDPQIESTMSQLLKEKFEKYWLDVYVPMAVATVLDPRYKLHLLNAILLKFMEKEDAKEKAAEVNKLLHNLVSEYNNDREGVATTYGLLAKAILLYACQQIQ